MSQFHARPIRHLNQRVVIEAFVHRFWTAFGLLVDFAIIQYQINVSVHFLFSSKHLIGKNGNIENVYSVELIYSYIPVVRNSSLIMNHEGMENK